LAHTIFKNSKKAVYRALFLTRDYDTKAQKSKKLPGKSNFTRFHISMMLEITKMVLLEHQLP
jgi:hypothetical protein